MNDDTNPNESNSGPHWSPDDFTAALKKTAFAFRGYNVTNLERTPELYACDNYRATLDKYLRRGSALAEDVTGRKVDLVERVQQKRDTSLATYHEAIPLIIAVEIAQLELLHEKFGVPWQQAPICYGFSLGEIGALVASGLFDLEDALRIPLELSADCVHLADNVSLGILFSRGQPLNKKDMHRCCEKISSEGQGTIGISAYLAPNSLLVVGQGKTLEILRTQLGEMSSERLHLRRSEHHWPPLHTPIVWQQNIPDRAARLLETTPMCGDSPSPSVFSLASGDRYDQYNARTFLRNWVDHAQQLWSAVDMTLSSGIETVVHVGPKPNIIPATFQRLAHNVESQTNGSIHMQALSSIIRRPWLSTLLPKRANLLRAPQIRHIMLEDWLIKQYTSI